MKIVRHIAPDMRQAMRSIREQLGEDAVILSSRRIPEGVEITAAVDFDASSLTGHQAQALTAAPLPTQPAVVPHASAATERPARESPAGAPAISHAPGSSAARAFAHAAATKAAAALAASQHEAVQPVMHAVPGVPYGAESWSTAGSPTQAPAPAYSHAAMSHYFPAASAGDAHPFAHILGPEPTP